MDWSHVITYLAGIVTGIAGQFFGARFTDTRREQEEAARHRRTFSKLAAEMLSLFRGLKCDVETDGEAYTRDVFLLPVRGVVMGPTDQSYFPYYESEHSELRAKFDMLASAGFVADVTRTNTPKYRLSEDFVHRLRGWRPPE